MKVGSLVECINSEGYGNYVVKGNIYTVREITTCNCGECKFPLLYLEEVKLDHNPFTGDEYAFDSQDFREVQEPMNVSDLIEKTISQVA